jgi:hypothetical protein
MDSRPGAARSRRGMKRRRQYEIRQPTVPPFDLHQQYRRACVLIVTASSNTSADLLGRFLG